MKSQTDSFGLRTMENMWSHLEKGHLDVSIEVIRGLGYSAAAVDIALDPDSYYFPAVRNGQIIRPSNIADDKIPIMTLQPDTTYEFEPPMLHSVQAESLEAKNIDSRTARSAFLAVNPCIELVSGSAEAQVLYKKVYAENRQIRSRPMIAFNAEIAAREGRDIACASVALHETVHIVQNLGNPIWNAEDILRRELEAYAAQATLVGSYDVPYSAEVLTAASIDQFRKAHLGASVYEIDDFYLREGAYHPQTQQLIQSVSKLV